MRGVPAFALSLFLLAAAPAWADTVHPLPYDLLFVRAPYPGAGPARPKSVWPDTVRPLTPDAGAQLVLLKRKSRGCATSASFPSGWGAVFTVSVRDAAGHTTKVVRAFGRRRS